MGRLETLQDAVDYWVYSPHLRAFALDRWEIVPDVFYENSEISREHPYAEACVEIEEGRDLCRLFVKYEVLQEPKWLYRTVLHELLHVAMRGLKVSAKIAESEWATHEEELFVDRLTTVLMKLCYDADC